MSSSSSSSSGENDYSPPAVANYTFNINGIAYSEYQPLPRQVKSQMAQCSFCAKFYQGDNNGMLTTKYIPGELVCFHCIFMVNYSQISSIDGVFGKTAQEYVAECCNNHSPAKCTHTSECLICDHINEKNRIAAQIENSKKPIASPYWEITIDI